MRTLCIIPARGGSKRIPRKNIKPFFGKPIMEYVIGEAHKSDYFNDVVVSTDDNEIASIATDCKALTHWRSEANSSDTAVLSDVLLEVLHSIAEQYDYICCLLPTAVLVDHRHIRSAFQVLKDRPEVDEVMSIVRFGYPIQRAVELTADGFVQLREPEHLNSLSNHLPPAYHDAGQFYWMRTADFMSQQKIILNRTVGYELLESEVQDIDTDEDWLLAEIKYSRRLEAQKAVVR